jgi:cysteinyl-tRNA synthetase
VTLRLHDSATHEIREFVPLVPGKAGVYVCGATPQSGPHLGHLRAQVAFDVLRRWLQRSGYEVTFIRNLTDIDDKILDKSARSGRPWWAHGFLFEQEFVAAYDAVNVLRPTYEPRATGHATEMVDLVQRLIDAGHAYAAQDGSGDVYFDVASWPSYGELTHQSPDNMEPSEDGPARGKRNTLDFALWKGAKQGEPPTASWPAPWGRGRPGWHLECSTMATRYLGSEFDIHGGGLDLRFPHHENELAQSRAAGAPFARYWLHNAWVVQSGEKMSKSLGNTLSVDALLHRVSGEVIRYLLVAPHYRSNIEISERSLSEAATAYERIRGFLTRAADTCGDVVAGTDPASVPLPAAFVDAMDDDLGTPAALAVVHDTVRAGNAALAAGAKEHASGSALAVRAMTNGLGLDPLDPAWRGTAGRYGQGGGSAGRQRALEALVGLELEARAQARHTKDWAAADAARDRLSAAGITVTDTPDGPHWTLEGEN